MHHANRCDTQRNCSRKLSKVCKGLKQVCLRITDNSTERSEEGEKVKVSDRQAVKSERMDKSAWLKSRSIK